MTQIVRVFADFGRLNLKGLSWFNLIAWLLMETGSQKLNEPFKNKSAHEMPAFFLR